MSNRHYDRHGRYIGSTKSQAEVDAENEGVAIVVLGLLAAAPILYAAYLLNSTLSEDLGWHPLFCLITSGLFLYLFYLIFTRFAVVRGLYFGGYSLAVSVAIFLKVQAESDTVWAVAASLLVFTVGCFVTREAVLEDW